MVDEALRGPGAGPDYNAMVSQRGVLNVYHSDAQRDAFARRGNAMHLAGADAEMLDAGAVRRMLPFLDFDNARFPIRGGLLQRRGGTARHDAVVWGYARGASDRGVDIIQNCEVTSFLREGNRVVGVNTTRGKSGNVTRSELLVGTLQNKAPRSFGFVVDHATAKERRCTGIDIALIMQTHAFCANSTEGYSHEPRYSKYRRNLLLWLAVAEPWAWRAPCETRSDRSRYPGSRRHDEDVAREAPATFQFVGWSIAPSHVSEIVRLWCGATQSPRRSQAAPTPFDRRAQHTCCSPTFR
jgi:hypothetical protein